MKAHIIETPMVTPKDIMKKLGIIEAIANGNVMNGSVKDVSNVGVDLAQDADFTVVNGKKVNSKEEKANDNE